MIDRQAEVVVRYSAAVRPGEVVSLLGPSQAEPLLVALYRAVLQAGGQPLLLVRPESCAELLQRHGNAQQLSFVDPFEAREVEVADVAIHVLRAPESRTTAALDPARKAVQQQARKPLVDLFFRRVAERQLRWTATLFACPEAAADSGWSAGEYQACLARACFLDRPDPAADWQALGQRQARLLESLKPTQELRLLTPAGTDLRLGVAGRHWHNGAGHENFPDGEVFVAPLEDATTGTVCFDGPVAFEGQEIAGIRLVFRSGRIVEASARRGAAVLQALLEQDAGAGVLGEAALGCNYALSRCLGHPLVDEKRGGTFHLALGASLPGSGGVNQSSLHLDLVGDLAAGGRVEADGRVISVNGRFVDPRWPQPEE